MIDKYTQEELRSKYNPDGSSLRGRQLKCLEMLKIVDKICRDNNITYWLSSGTLLGAVRHGGFIPWDDDVDIEILYKDMQRFIKVCREQLPEGFVLQNNDSDPLYVSNILKIRSLYGYTEEKIILSNKEYTHRYKYNGYFIDIFTEEKSTRTLVLFSRKLLMLLFFAKYRWNFPHFLLSFYII